MPAPALFGQALSGRFEEMSYRETAGTLAISPKTVENQLGKALRILRERLGTVLRNRAAWLL